ncbi:MAG: FAD-dependent oxidoreductase [Candidatus Velthaea sp.]
MTELTGRLIDAGSPGWEEARRNFRSCVDYTKLVPKGVLYCQSAQDVANAVLWCRENGVPLRVRSGGHSHEAFSVAADALVVDVSEMDAISVDRQANTARVGAGVYCLDLHLQLYGVGATLPAASGASVGIAGLALGGGFGVTSRKYGGVPCKYDVPHLRPSVLRQYAGGALSGFVSEFQSLDPDHSPQVRWKS